MSSFKIGDKVCLVRKWDRWESDVAFGALLVGQEFTLVGPDEKPNTWEAKREGSGLEWTLPECAIKHVDCQGDVDKCSKCDEECETGAGTTVIVETAVLPMFKGYTFQGLRAAEEGEYVLSEDGELIHCDTDMWMVGPVWVKDKPKARTPVLPGDWDKRCVFWDDHCEWDKQTYRLRGQANGYWIDEDGDTWDNCEVLEDN